MIEIDGLTKRYGDKTAVDGLSFAVEPGVVTGFLGPNGAGKSTTMRMIAGLDRPTSGTVRVNGKHYPGAAAPMSELGILLDARSVHPGLSARNNLLALARTAGIGRRRVDEVIELAGLGEVAGARAAGFSLGMGQRLGVAAALRSPRWRRSAKGLQCRRDGARTGRSAPLGRPCLAINGQRIVGRAALLFLVMGVSASALTRHGANDNDTGRPVSGTGRRSRPGVPSGPPGQFCTSFGTLAS